MSQKAWKLHIKAPVKFLKVVNMSSSLKDYAKLQLCAHILSLALNLRSCKAQFWQDSKFTTKVKHFYRHYISIVECHLNICSISAHQLMDQMDLSQGHKAQLEEIVFVFQPYLPPDVEDNINAWFEHSGVHGHPCALKAPYVFLYASF